MTRKNKNTMSLYVRDTDTIRSLADDVAHLYYEAYGEFPSQAEVIEKSLVIAKDYLSGHIQLKKKNVKVSELFARS